MKIKQEYFICDICNKKIKSFDKSNTFSYKEGWQNGSHSGLSDVEGHVCNKCKKSKLRRFVAYHILKNFN